MQIPQPHLISMHNKYMGGVDLHDNDIANYRISIGRKNWWWSLFTNIIDRIIGKLCKGQFRYNGFC